MAENAGLVPVGAADQAARLRLMLADPIVRAVMACDGVSEREVKRVVAVARERRFGGRRVSPHGDRPPPCGTASHGY